MKKLALPLLLAFSYFSFAQTPQTSPTAPPPDQNQRPRGEGRPGFGRGFGGEIKSIQGDTITLTTRDGATATVKVSSDTRFMREGQPAKLSDFKSGDRVMVRGESTGENAWKAEMIGTLGGFGPGRGGPGGPGNGPGGPGGGPGMERIREGMGKEFIAGEVKSIEGTKITVRAPDGKDYTGEVDENTSFRKGRESITFPDIKVGDRVMGRGKLNSAGVFVVESLNVGGGRMIGGPGQPPAPPKQ